MSAAPDLAEFLPPNAEPTGASIGSRVRAHLEALREHLAARHRSGESGRSLNEAHASAMDALIVRLLGLAVVADEEPQLSVVAVGGYGRREQSIHSDVDLLLLHGDGASAVVNEAAERLQRWLWDAGLTLGCATRGADETLALAAEDMTVCTAVLDARRLWGPQEPVDDLLRRLLARLREEPAAFVEAQIAALQERHLKYGESLYLLQPNVKEGAGGLRDYHAAWWVARVVHPEVCSFGDLEGDHRLTRTEMKAYVEALDFLWRLRNQLHLRAGRAADQMSFELQEGVATAFGYGVMGSELPVETFMGDYYRHARVVQNLSDLLLELARARTRPPSRRLEAEEDGFRIVDGHLEIPSAAHLRERPLRLLQAFEVAQRHEVPLSRTAQRLVRENLGLVDAEFQRDDEAAACIDRILSAEHRVTRSLMAMNETGLLGVYWPEWEHIVFRWQHVIYHTYTVDVHSIFLVEELRRLWQGKYQAAVPELTELMRGVKDRTILFMGSLLHDVGKGRGGDHSLLGTDLARSLLGRMGIAEERAKRVRFLVEYHLRMSHLAQRRDLSDPKLIVEFAGLVGDRINLRNLYLLTFADIRASSRDAWTEWKGQLLRELFERTADYLEAGGDDPRVAVEQVEVRVGARKEEARHELSNLGVAAERVDAFFDEMPRRYFIAHTGPQITRHAMAMLSFRPDDVVSTAVRSMRGDFSELIVVTRDVHGLYAKVAGAITAKWISILGAHVYTTRSGLALEIYRLATPAGGPQELRELWRGLQETLRRVLSGEADVPTLLDRRGRPLGETAAPRRGSVEVNITNEESEFYTIADVTADDRLGLLYDLTHAVAEEGLEIYMSKASTLLDQVADTFYLKDSEGRKILDPKVLERLETSLRIAAAGDDG